MSNSLQNKNPLIEAILEIRWHLQTNAQNNVRYDPHYQILVGRLYERIKNDYPVFEQLPTSLLPLEVVPYTVQYRFRKKENSWPLIQLGPGVLTLNETTDYSWDTFRKFSVEAEQALLDAYLKRDDLKFSVILLRYLNTTEFDYNNNDISDFLLKQMAIKSEMPNALFKSNKINSRPQSVELHYEFNCTNPDSDVVIHLNTALMSSKPIISWETTVAAQGPKIPKYDAESFGKWIDSAHSVIEECFDSLWKTNSHS